MHPRVFERRNLVESCCQAHDAFFVQVAFGVGIAQG